VRLRDYFQKH